MPIEGDVRSDFEIRLSSPVHKVGTGRGEARESSSRFYDGESSRKKTRVG